MRGFFRDDVRHAGRVIRRRPAAAILVAMTLAIGGARRDGFARHGDRLLRRRHKANTLVITVTIAAVHPGDHLLIDPSSLRTILTLP